MKFFQVIFTAKGNIVGQSTHPKSELAFPETIDACIKDLGIAEKQLKIGVEYSATLNDEQYECVTFQNDGLFYLVGRNISENINLKEEIVSQNRIADLNMVRLLKTLDELNTAKTELEKVARYRENFISNISHEMRTPLTAIVGFSEILADMTVDSESLDYLDLIRRSSDDLLVIINDLLDISQINTGKISITNKEFNILTLLNRVINSVSYSLQGKNISLDLKVSPDFPMFLIGDKVRLLQILTNLLNNAIKYSDKGNVTLKAEIFKDNDKTCVCRFTVKDTGYGIEKDQLENIFSEFYQVKSTSTSPLVGGIGLGLAITQRLVTLMDGDIDVKSKVGKGSEFTVTIPFLHTKRRQRLAEAGEETGFFGNVLLVEDIKTNQKIVGKVLSGFNVDLGIANDGEEAVKLLKENNFDIIFFNPQLQNADWRLIVQEAKKQQGGDIPLVIISISESFDRKPFVSQGITDFIYKPFDHQSFLEVTKKYLSF